MIRLVFSVCHRDAPEPEPMMSPFPVHKHGDDKRKRQEARPIFLQLSQALTTGAKERTFFVSWLNETCVSLTRFSARIGTFISQTQESLQTFASTLQGLDYNLLRGNVSAQVSAQAVLLKPSAPRRGLQGALVHLLRPRVAAALLLRSPWQSAAPPASYFVQPHQIPEQSWEPSQRPHPRRRRAARVHVKELAAI